MGIFDVFKKKQRAPWIEPDSKQELFIPPPPSPAERGMSKELPGFPKYEVREDKTPHLPSFSPDSKQPETSTIIPKLSKVESASKPLNLEEKFPEISPYALEPEQIQKRVEVKRPVSEKKTFVESIFEEKPHYENVVGEVRRSLHEPESFVKKPIFVNINDYKVLLEDVLDIRKSLNGLKISVAKIDSIKEKEDTEYKNWQKILDDMKKKFLFVDEILFESKG